MNAAMRALLGIVLWVAFAVCVAVVWTEGSPATAILFGMLFFLLVGAAITITKLEARLAKVWQLAVVEHRIANATRTVERAEATFRAELVAFATAQKGFNAATMKREDELTERIEALEGRAIAFATGAGGKPH